MLLIQLTGNGGDQAGAGAVVRRLPLRAGSNPALRERDESRPVLRLLCLLCVQLDSPLERLRSLLLRMEDL